MPVRTGRAWRVLGVLTPSHGRVACTMLDSLRNETVVGDPAAREAFAVKPRGLSEAIERALTSEDHELPTRPGAMCSPKRLHRARAASR